MANLDFNNLDTPTNGTHIIGFTSTTSGGECDFKVVDLKKAFAAVASTGAYSDLTSKPSLSTVATTGAYSDLTGKPSLAIVATSGSYNDLTGKPSLATVASTGAYSDLTGKPSLAIVATSGSYNDLTGKPSLATVASTGAYSDLTGKPDLTSVATLEYVTVTQNRTLQASDKNKILHVTGTVNITLPNSLSSGFSAIIMNEDANRTQITVTTGSIKSKAINLDSQYGGATVWKNGSSWYGVGDLT